MLAYYANIVVFTYYYAFNFQSTYIPISIYSPRSENANPYDENYDQICNGKL